MDVTDLGTAFKTKQANHLAGVSKLIISSDKCARRRPQDSGDL